MTVAPAVNMRQVERYAQLKDAKRALESEIEKIKKELGPLEQKLLDSFAEQGVQNIKTESGFTVYLSGKWWARPTDGDYERACTALREAGLEGMVHETVNIQTLSAYVRELKKEDKELPFQFDGAIAVTETFNVLVRKS